MSNYMSYYLGPYAQIRTKRVERTYNTCWRPAAECPRPSEGYCSKCGKSAADLTRTEQISEPELEFEVGDLIGLTRDENKAAGEYTHYYQSNLITGPGVSWNKYDEPEGALEITPERIAAEIETFKTMFADDLATLAEQAPVTIHWGRLSHWG